MSATAQFEMPLILTGVSLGNIRHFLLENVYTQNDATNKQPDHLTNKC